ncbi:MAG: AMP-binding protein [Proteobacteria bacterium]|nr:AMP-binding protein [Pseudomonadota bacterium]MBU1640117.1 AMP-binding protein [Pseudomonadota bacterium]
MEKSTLNTALAWRSGKHSDLADMQHALLQNHVRQAMHSAFYNEKFTRLGLHPQDITSLHDLPALPLTSRQDLNNASHLFQAACDEDIVDLSLTSGTTGSPVQVPYTKNDLTRLALNEAIAFWGAGVRPKDRFLVCVTLDRCFIAGLAYYSGMVELGATAIRSGPGQPARQWQLIKQLRPAGLIGVPSFLLEMARWGQEHGYSPPDMGITSLITIGEPIRRADFALTALGEELTQAWNAPIYVSYGATELETGISECKQGCGGHIHPEMSLVEIIDDQGNLVADGEPGELVVTPLGVEGFPLVRFRTGDITRLYREPCACGWQTPRIGPIEGRLAQRLKVRGTTIYPDIIFQTLQKISAIEAAYIEVRAAYDLSDDIHVVVGTRQTLDAKEVESLLQAQLRVRLTVEIQALELVQKTMSGGHKPKKFFDLRDKKI